MALAIITYGIAVSGDRYNQFIRFLGDGQGSRCCCDLIVFRHILLTCHDLHIFCCSDRSRVASYIRSFCFRFHIMCMIFQKSCWCYSGQGLGGACVGSFSAFAGKGYWLLGDRQVSIIYYYFDVAVVRRGHGKVFGFQAHRIGSCICSACLCHFSFFQGYRNTLWSLKSETGYFLALAIITFFLAVSSDRYGHFIRYWSDGQGSRRRCDRIVFRHILLACQDLHIFRFGDRSQVASYIRSFCFRFHIMCMAIQKSFYGYSGKGLKFAIIRLAVAFAGKGYRSRSDLHICRDHFGFPVLRFH